MIKVYQKIKSFIGIDTPSYNFNGHDFPVTQPTFSELGSQLLQAVAAARDIHYALQSRERILSIISKAASNFLDPHINTWNYLPFFINELGQAILADRIFLLKYNSKEDVLSILEKYIYEKDNLDIFISKSINQFKNIHQTKELKFYFQSKIKIWNLNMELESDLQHHLQIFKIKSLCVIPIIPEDNLFGVIVIHNCTSDKVWSKLEINTLQIIANLLGAWRKRKMLEQSLKKHQDHLEQVVLERTKKLYHSIEMFRSLTESSPDSIIRFDCNYKCIFANKVVSQHSGISIDRLLLSPLDDIFSDEYIQIIKNILDYVVENGEGFNIELQFPKTKLWIDWKFEPEFNSSNKVCNIIAVGRNITRRKLADNTLTTYLSHRVESAMIQESSYKTIFEILSFPAVVCNTGDLIIDSNKLAKKIFSKKQLIGVNCSDLFVNKDCIIKYKKQLQDNNEESCSFLGEIKAGDRNIIYNITLSIIPNTKNFICIFEKGPQEDVQG